jgi:hypothetical protein
MIKNYFKTAWRNLWKNKTYSFLNIFGLAIGITCAGLIFLWVEDETTYNHHNQKRDQLFMVMENQTYEGKTYTFSATPGLLGPVMKDAPGLIGLAVFTSEGCGLCRALAPAVAAFGTHPTVVLRTFDEVEGAAAWSAADVPGSPFAIALDADGTVLAKGTFNTGAQLESVLAAAERRRGAVSA